VNRLIGLFIGVSEFFKIPSISSAQKEAIALAETFKKYWYSSNAQISVLLNPSYGETRRNLNTFVQHIEKNDTVVFYFSGHGVMNGGKAYLVPTNGSLSSDDITMTCISLEKVIRDINNSQALQKIIIIEACHAGIQTLDGFALGTLTAIPSIEEFSSNRFIALISAGSAHESVYGGMIYSVFTESLINGINALASKDQKYLDLMSLFQYTRDQVVQRTEGRQRPSMSFCGSSSYINLTKKQEDTLEVGYGAQPKTRDQEIESYKRESSNIMEIARLLASRQLCVENTVMNENQSNSETYNTDLQNANVANFANKVQDNARQQANQYNYAPEQQSLAQAATEIQRLLKQLETTNPTATLQQKKDFVDIGFPPTLKQRLLGALKSGGQAVIEEFLDNAYVNVGMAIIEGWQEEDL
jgi:hypothetical protein